MDIEPDVGSDFTSTTKGLGDLGLGGRYRLMDGSLQVDLLGEFRLSTGDNETDDKSNGDSESNNKNGGHVVEFGTQVGQKLSGYQWALAALYKRNLKGTADDNSTKTDFDAFNSYELRADSLMGLSEITFLRTYLDVTIQDRYEDENNDEVNASSTQYKLGAEYQYMISQDLMVRGGVNYTTTNTSRVDDFNYWSVLAGANYQF